MYSDPALIRKHPVKLMFSDAEFDLVSAYCTYTGEQRAVLLREMILKQAVELLSHGMDVASGAMEMTRPQQSQLAA